MSIAIEGLLFGWAKNVEYGPKLVSDLSEEQMILQPAPDGSAPANHPSWIFSHLNAYHPVMEALIKGEEFEDPKGHPFGMESKPVQDQSIYSSKDQLVGDFILGHQKVEQLLRSTNESVLNQEVKLPRWKDVFSTVGIALPYLMLVHENSHLGQLSAWRRIQGMPSV